MAADDVFGDLTALGRKQDLLARTMRDESVALHALQGCSHSRRRDVESFRQPRRDDWTAVTGEVVQDLQVVLNHRRSRFGAVPRLPTLRRRQYRSNQAVAEA